MRKLIAVFTLLTIVIITACSQKETGGSEEMQVSLDMDWSMIEELAEGTEVRIFMWGGDEGINQYMDEWVAPNLMDEYGVKLVRTPMDTHEILQKLMTEKLITNWTF